MAYVEADYLSDVLGGVTEFETLGWIVYVPKLKRNIILSADLYNALDEQELASDGSKKIIEQECLKTLDNFTQEWKAEREEEKGL
ncbi:hypothetical protein AALH12_06895 [Streptococcus ferus]|uniref:hypothetical protein n=1 Tax=Streptococcus ferus TaxID=1345 RepID=UPI0035187E4D